MPSNVELTALFFLQLAVILLACRLVGAVLVRVGQPQVVADLLAGFALGPLLLGSVAPRIESALFPTGPSMSVLYVVGQLGLALYMFLVGLSFDTALLRAHVRTSVVTGAASLVAPLVAGAALGLLLVRGGWFPSRVAGWQAMLFVGTAIAVSAFPVLARIVHDRGLTRTRIGTIALACAATDDAVAWILLATVLATGRAQPGIAVVALLGGTGYTLVMLVGARPALHRFARWSGTGAGIRPAALPSVAIFVLLCAWFTEATGVYAVFGAFVAGAVMPRGRFADQLYERLAPVTVSVLLPVFFVLAGLRALPASQLTPAVLAMTVAVTLVAVLSKGGACTLASRYTGTPWREAVSVGALMNARGLMELVLLDAGITAGIITPALYTVFAVMTIVTTLLAVPVHGLAVRGARSRAGADRQRPQVHLPVVRPGERGELPQDGHQVRR